MRIVLVVSMVPNTAMVVVISRLHMCHARSDVELIYYVCLDTNILYVSAASCTHAVSCSVMDEKHFPIFH